MPSIQVTGQLVDPTTGVEGSADIRIASLINYGQTTKKSISHKSTDASGNYDFQLVYGKHLILVKFKGERIYNKVGYAVVGDSTPDPVDLIQLINLSDENPPSELVTELQQLRKDTLNDIVSTSAEVLENAGYKGLWPDTGGSALKGETWQTQVGGTPTGEYYTALQNTTVDPVEDNVNWKRNGDINRDNLSNYTYLVYKASDGNSAVENMIAGEPITAKVGDLCRADGIDFERVAVSQVGTISDFERIAGDATLSLYTFINSSFPVVSSVRILETGLYLHRTGNQASPSKSFNETGNGTITDASGNEFSVAGNYASISQLKVNGEANLTGLFVGALSTLDNLEIDELTDINQAVIDGSSCNVFGNHLIRNFAGGTHRMMTITNSPDLKFSHAGFDANLDNVTNSVSKLDPVIDVQTSDRVFFDCPVYTSGSETIGVISFVLFTNDSKHCRVVNATDVKGVRTLAYWRKGCHYPKACDVKSEDLGLQSKGDHLIDFEGDVSVVQDGTLDNRNNWVSDNTIFGGKISRIVNHGSGQAYQMTGACVNCRAKNCTQIDSWETDVNTAGFKFDRVGPNCSSTGDFYSGQGIGINDQNDESYGILVDRFEMDGTSALVSSTGIRSGYTTSVRGRASKYSDVNIYGLTNIGILTTQPGATVINPTIVARFPIDSGVSGSQRRVDNLRIEGGELISIHQHCVRGNSQGTSIKGVTMRGHSVSAIRFIGTASLLRINGNNMMNGDATDQIEMISPTSNTGCIVAYNAGLKSCAFNAGTNKIILDDNL